MNFVGLGCIGVMVCVDSLREDYNLYRIIALDKVCAIISLGCSEVFRRCKVLTVLS